MLFQVWEGDIFRPTKDIDLLSFGKPDLDYYKKVVQEICSQSFPDDGVSFDIDSVQTSRIKEEDEYQGLRVQLFAFLGSARVRVQIDIGFGDAVTPEPLDINYPTILAFPAPILKAYSRETSVAEKFHAMVNLGIANSRMKDFYDIWTLLKSYQFDGAILSQAIFDTFERRKTIISNDIPLVFTEEFYKDNSKQTQWNAFLRKGKYKETIALADLVLLIKELLLPVFETLGANKDFHKKWNSIKFEWED